MPGYPVQNLCDPRVTNGVFLDFCESLQSNAWLSNQMKKQAEICRTHTCASRMLAVGTIGFRAKRPFMRKQDDRAASSQRSRMDQHHGQPDSAVGGLRQITEAFPWDGAYMIRDRDNRCGKWH
jgi:hypothetical protein